MRIKEAKFSVGDVVARRTRLDPNKIRIKTVKEMIERLHMDSDAYSFGVGDVSIPFVEKRYVYLEDLQRTNPELFL